MEWKSVLEQLPDKNGVYLVGGMMKCKNCSNPLKHNERYDAYYCDNCNAWAEKKCEDEECYFCKDRPEELICGNN